METMRFVGDHMYDITTHWQHPNHYGFFAGPSSTVAMAGELVDYHFENFNKETHQSSLIDKMERGITEAIRKAFAIPDVFSPAKGGFGSIQPSAGNCSMLCAHVAKSKSLYMHKDDPKAKDKLVCYFSEVSHGHAVRASIMNGYPYYRESKAAWDEKAQNFVYDIPTLTKSIEKDVSAGLIPCFIIAVVGSTSCGGMDDITTLAQIAKKHHISLFVDGAWGGNFTVHQDYRDFLKGVEEADFYQFNPSKLLGAGMNTSLVWMNNREDAARAFQVPNCDSTPITSFKLGDTVKSSILKFHVFLQTYGIDRLRKTA